MVAAAVVSEDPRHASSLRPTSLEGTERSKFLKVANTLEDTLTGLALRFRLPGQEAPWVGESRLVSELPHDPFGVGSIVSLRADASRTGAIIAELPAIGGRRRFNVYHSPTRSRVYFEDQLQPVARSGGDEWAEALADGQFVDPVEFRARLTATRLNNPQTDHLYSLRSARIQFIPFQYKPMLRMLRADRPRLLIADDVGVGKTIEAGLILKELATSHDLRMSWSSARSALATNGVRDAAVRRGLPHSGRPRLCGLPGEADMEGWPRRCVHVSTIVPMELIEREEGGRRHRGLLELEQPRV